MCEFCTKHGDGKIWYRNAANYSADLLSDLNRRSYIETFLSSAFAEGFQALGRLETIFRKKGRLPEKVKAALIAKAKTEHFGQVLPIEDIRDVVNKAVTVVRMPCACRWDSQHQEVRCCFAVSYGLEPWYQGIDMSYFGSLEDGGLERLAPEAAVEQMEALDAAGAVHSIWTMMTPFIGAVCNCTPHDCLAMRTLTGIRVETMARAEWVAVVDETLCSGCGLCAGRCHFDALHETVMREGRSMPRVDEHRCFGCGLCRTVCATGALAMRPRVS